MSQAGWGEERQARFAASCRRCVSECFFLDSGFRAATRLLSQDTAPSSQVNRISFVELRVARKARQNEVPLASMKASDPRRHDEERGSRRAQPERKGAKSAKILKSETAPMADRGFF